MWGCNHVGGPCCFVVYVIPLLLSLGLRVQKCLGDEQTRNLLGMCGGEGVGQINIEAPSEMLMPSCAQKGEDKWPTSVVDSPCGLPIPFW